VRNYLQEIQCLGALLSQVFQVWYKRQFPVEDDTEEFSFRNDWQQSVAKSQLRFIVYATLVTKVNHNSLCFRELEAICTAPPLQVVKRYLQFSIDSTHITRATTGEQIINKQRIVHSLWNGLCYAIYLQAKESDR
jgi:hypothetical protein